MRPLSGSCPYLRIETKGAHVRLPRSEQNPGRLPGTDGAETSGWVRTRPCSPTPGLRDIGGRPARRRVLPARLVVPPVQPAGPHCACRTRNQKKLACGRRPKDRNNRDGDQQDPGNSFDRDLVCQDAAMILHKLISNGYLKLVMTHLPSRQFRGSSAQQGSEEREAWEDAGGGCKPN